MTELAAPVVAALSNADDVLREKIKKEVFQAINQQYPEQHVFINGSSLVIYGEK